MITKARRLRKKYKKDNRFSTIYTKYITFLRICTAFLSPFFRLLIYNYIANRQRLRCVLQINERRYINMRIKVYGKSHLEGIAKKTGNPYNFNQVHYLGKARNVEGQAALTLALDPRDYPIDRIEVGKEYDVEFDQRGYVIGFTLAR